MRPPVGAASCGRFSVMARGVACHTGTACAGGVTHALAPRNLGRTGHDVRPFQASWPCLARAGGVIHAPSPRNLGRAGCDRDPSGRCGRASHGQHTSRWPGGRRAVANARWGWDPSWVAMMATAWAATLDGSGLTQQKSTHAGPFGPSRGRYPARRIPRRRTRMRQTPDTPPGRMRPPVGAASCGRFSVMVRGVAA